MPATGACAAARGEWLAFHDADDRMLPGGIAALMRPTTDPAVVAVIGQRVWSDGERTWLSPLYDIPDIREPGRKSIATHPGLLYYAAVTGKVYHRSLLDGLTFEGRVLGDQAWTIKALLRAGNGIEVIDDTVFEWSRPHPDRFVATITSVSRSSADRIDRDGHRRADGLSGGLCGGRRPDLRRIRLGRRSSWPISTGWSDPTWATPSAPRSSAAIRQRVSCSTRSRRSSRVVPRSILAASDVLDHRPGAVACPELGNAGPVGQAGLLADGAGRPAGRSNDGPADRHLPSCRACLRLRAVRSAGRPVGGVDGPVDRRARQAGPRSVARRLTSQVPTIATSPRGAGQSDRVDIGDPGQGPRGRRFRPPARGTLRKLSSRRDSANDLIATRTRRRDRSMPT